MLPLPQRLQWSACWPACLDPVDQHCLQAALTIAIPACLFPPVSPRLIVIMHTLIGLQEVVPAITAALNKSHFNECTLERPGNSPAAVACPGHMLHPQQQSLISNAAMETPVSSIAPQVRKGREDQKGGMCKTAGSGQPTDNGGGEWHTLQNRSRTDRPRQHQQASLLIRSARAAADR